MGKRRPKIENVENFVSLEKFGKKKNEATSLKKEKKETIKKEKKNEILIKANDKILILTKRNIELEDENKILKVRVENLEDLIDNNGKKTDSHKISADNRDEEIVADFLKENKKSDGYEENY